MSSFSYSAQQRREADPLVFGAFAWDAAAGEAPVSQPQVAEEGLAVARTDPTEATDAGRATGAGGAALRPPPPPTPATTRRAVRGFRQQTPTAAFGTATRFADPARAREQGRTALASVGRAPLSPERRGSTNGSVNGHPNGQPSNGSRLSSAEIRKAGARRAAAAAASAAANPVLRPTVGSTGRLDRTALATTATAAATATAKTATAGASTSKPKPNPKLRPRPPPDPEDAGDKGARHGRGRMGRPALRRGFNGYDDSDQAHKSSNNKLGEHEAEMSVESIVREITGTWLGGNKCHTPLKKRNLTQRR